MIRKDYRMSLEGINLHGCMVYMRTHSSRYRKDAIYVCKRRDQRLIEASSRNKTQVQTYRCPM